MIGATYAVPDACIGSAQSLSRSLSPVDQVPAESSPATHRRRLFSRRQPLPQLPTDQFSHRIPHCKLQKTIQYPETRSGSVQ
jgi:hypothetical protein